MNAAPGAERAYRRVLIAIPALCAITPCIWAVKLIIAPHILYPDFFGLWAFGRYALTHPPATIYNHQSMLNFETGFGMPDGSFYQFFYPPWSLLLLVPFGAMPYAAARLLWLALTFAAYIAALGAWRWQLRVLALLVLAPSSVVCFLVGQNGFVTAALMLGGLRLLRATPLVAGALLGALAYKPQLAILVPFVLLFGGHWRALAGAALCVAALSLATTLAFGIHIWGAWLASLHGQAAAVSEGRAPLLDMMPTVTSAALLLGGGKLIAILAQAAGTLAGVLAVWRVRARTDVPAQAVLPLATILATPYAFDYDLPMVTGAVLAVLAQWFTGGRLDQPRFLILLACIVVPMILPVRLGLLAAIMPVIFACGLWDLCRLPIRTEAADGEAWPERLPPNHSKPA